MSQAALTTGLNRSLRSLGRAKARPLTKRYAPLKIISEISGTEMTGITLNEIYALDLLKKVYIRERLERIVTLLVSTAGFCIATLSSQEIPPAFNFVLTFIVLLYFIFLLLSAKHRNSPLKTQLDKLYKKYKNHDETIKHLDTTNPWLGFEAEKVSIFMPALISALFGIYTLAEHACRAFKPLCS